MNAYTKNNFDLIRLVAALQVVLFHLIHHFHLSGLEWFNRIILPFPGVPIFFFVSGLLISAAWDRNPSLRIFFLNRFYRIFPGLWVCVLVSVVSLLFFYDIKVLKENFALLLLWIGGQSTIFQLWNPGFLRNYGLGVVNGSLWTISVELCFYLFVPVFYWFLKYSKAKKPFVLAVIIFVSFSLNYFLIRWHPVGDTLSGIQKLFYLTFLPWLGMFCSGMLANVFLDRFLNVVKNRLLVIVIFFVLVSMLTFYMPLYPLLSFGNSLGVINFIALCFLILAIAFTNPGLSDKLLRKNDFSYGVYIYHQPAMNVFLALNITGITGFISSIGVTVFLSVASWFFVEKPALRLKTKTLHKR